jgi:hypothetical protein
MHIDGELPWPEAAAAALADVLRRGRRVAEGAARLPHRPLGAAAAPLQATLFPVARGPYG